MKPPKELAASLRPLPAAFYQNDTVEVARQLLGKVLFVAHRGHVMLAEIHEVEAYLGQGDPASHTFRGPSKRNRTMFELGGACYVYLSYGINFCMNAVTGPLGQGEGVLIRAAAPLSGIEEMARNRGIVMGGSGLDSDSIKRKLMSGPGKLTQSLGIGLEQDGWTFFRDDFKIVDLGHKLSDHDIVATPRIGISKAQNELFRFVIKGSPWLSR